MRPLTLDRAGRRLGDAGDQLQQRALARAVAADDAERPAARHRERHVAHRGERLVRPQVAHQAARQQRALQRRELLPPAVAAVDLRGVGDFDGVHVGYQLPVTSCQFQQCRSGNWSWNWNCLTLPPQTYRAAGRTRNSRTERTATEMRAERRAATSSGRPGRGKTGSPGSVIARCVTSGSGSAARLLPMLAWRIRERKYG